MSKPIYTFDSTHHAMWAEEVAKGRAIPVDVVSAPAMAEAKCGLALTTVDEHSSALEQALQAEGIHFSRL